MRKAFVRGGVTLAILAAGIAAVLLLVNWDRRVWAMLTPDHVTMVGSGGAPRDLGVEAWEADAGHMAAAIDERMPPVPRAGDEHSTAALLESAVGSFGDAPHRNGRILHLMLLAASVGAGTVPGTGHTAVPAFQWPLDWGFYPFAAYFFEDGLRAVLTRGDADPVRGLEIVALGGVPVDEVIRRATPFVSADNSSGLLDELAPLLSYPGFLHGLGITDDTGTLELTLRAPDGQERTATINPIALASLKGLQWGRTLQDAAGTWSPADPRRRARNFTLDYRAGDRLLYVQVNRVADEPDGESISAFAARIGRVLDDQPVDRVVIDLRANQGGNNQLIEPLVAMLSGHPVADRRGVLYTLIGRRTYSAAGALATALERRTRTLFAGEPSGFAPNHLGDAVTLPLPNTRILVDVATRYWEDGGPHDRREWLEPDLPVALRYADHATDTDPVLAAVLAHAAAPVSTVELSPALCAATGTRLAGRYRFSPHHVMEILPVDGDCPDGVVAQLDVTGVEPWIASDLYLSDASATRFATDMAGVFLTLGADGAVALEWHGAVYPMPQTDGNHRLPVDDVRAGAVGDSSRLRMGIAELRALAAAGATPDARMEMELNRIGYALLRAGRREQALAVFELNTELFSGVANTFDSLGDAYHAGGEVELAVQAFRRAVELDPAFEHPREMLAELGRGPAG